MSKRIDLKNLSSDKMAHHKRKASSASPLFSGSGYKINQPKITSEFEKIYKGEPSKHDSVDLVREYSKAGPNKHSKESYVTSSLTNDNDEYDEISKAYMGLPSELDHIDLKQEYRKPPKIKETSNLFGDEDTYDFVTEQEQDFVTSSPAELPIVKGDIIQGTAQSMQNDVGKIDRALAIAEDFVRRNNLISVGEVLWRYNGIFYYIFTESEAKRLIFQTYKKEISRASPVSTIRNVLELLKYCTDKVLGEFPVNPNIIVFENGTLEVTTGRFRNNSPNDLASSALGISYNPSRKEMPWTHKFLTTIADGDSDLYELMLQVIGYILSNDTRAKSFFYLEGVGNAGKSRFCDLVASFFPESGPNKVARIALQDLGGRFALLNLVNAKLNISEDLPDSPLSPMTVSRIKMISDANRLEAEGKYIQSFSFKPLCKLLFATNHPLRLKEYDSAFVNRVVYIPFLNAIPKHKQDPMILEKMKKELPALFSHAFKAYCKLVANGYRWAGANRFKPEIHVVNSGIAFDKERILRDFVDNCCIFADDAITPTINLQLAYQTFCQERKYTPIQGDRFSRELAIVLPDSVSRVKIGNQQRGFKGIKLKVVTGVSEV